MDFLGNNGPLSNQMDFDRTMKLTQLTYFIDLSQNWCLGSYEIDQMMLETLYDSGLDIRDHHVKV